MRFTNLNMAKNLKKTEPSSPPKFVCDNQEIYLADEQEAWIKAAVEATGTNDTDMMVVLLNQSTGALPSNVKENEQWINAAAAMLHGIGPKDELEGMLAAQMVAVHNLSMEVAKRATHPDQTSEGVNFNVNRMAKLMRTFTAQMDALQKYRNKGQQTIQVQHVNVSNGGQAVVGNIHKGGE